MVDQQTHAIPSGLTSALAVSRSRHSQFRGRVDDHDSGSASGWNFRYAYPEDCRVCPSRAIGVPKGKGTGRGGWGASASARSANSLPQAGSVGSGPAGATPAYQSGGAGGHSHPARLATRHGVSDVGRHKGSIVPGASPRGAAFRGLLHLDGHATAGLAGVFPLLAELAVFRGGEAEDRQ